MDKKHKGAASELVAAAWLLTQGYEVFRNVSPHGLIDIVGIKEGMVEYFDVRSANKQGEANRLSDEAVEKNVKMLAVYRDNHCEIVPPKIKPKLFCKQCGKSLTGRRSVFCSTFCDGRFWREQYNAV